MPSLKELAPSFIKDAHVETQEIPVDLTLAWTFQGQGSQRPGMGKEAYDLHPLVQEIFQAVDRRLYDALEFRVSSLCFDGSEEDLKKYAQEAIITTNAGLLIALIDEEQEGFTQLPGYMSGISLGLYSSLWPAGVTSLMGSIDLVHARAKGMRKANERHPGKMVAVPLEEDNERVQQLIKPGSGVYLSLINSSKQVVLGGEEKRIINAAGKLAEQDIEVTDLDTDGAFHTPLMEEAEGPLREAIDRTEFRKPKTILIGNTQAIELSTERQIEEELIRQLTHTVRWSDVTRYLFEEKGVVQAAEVGEKRILSNINRRERGGEIKQIKIGLRTLGAIGAGAVGVGIAAATIWRLHQYHEKK